MYISASQIKKLELSLNKSNKGIERIIIHDEPSGEGSTYAYFQKR